MAIFLASRNLDGVPVGSHQFVVLTGDYTMVCRTLSAFEAQGRFLGKEDRQDVYGVVVGAHNVDGRLVVKYFQEADLAATLEHFGARRPASLGGELHPVTFAKLPETAAIERVLERIENYRINVTESPINYPTLGLGFNSNSWAQSVIRSAGGDTVENTSGLDFASNRRIPAIYFEPLCLARPRVN